MNNSGCLRKMLVSLDKPVTYRLPLNDEQIPLNPYIGKEISLHFQGSIQCIACGREIKKSFNQGYCYPCFRSLARCDICIVRPEQCHFDAGTCREPEWAQDHCMQAHIVYLANSSGPKVGITRQSQIPTRWIDQGAVQALPLLQVATRLHAGQAEVIFKQHIGDRTDWRRMLRGIPENAELPAIRDSLLNKCGDMLETINEHHKNRSITWLDESSVTEIEYPVMTYPDRITSFNFDKEPLVRGMLTGIKGQYLIFDSGVINIRKFAGYAVNFQAS